MPEEQKGEGEQRSCCCSKCCGGAKVLIGGLIGFLLAAAGFGLYHAGKCAGRACPVVSQTQAVK